MRVQIMRMLPSWPIGRQGIPPLALLMVVALSWRTLAAPTFLVFGDSLSADGNGAKLLYEKYLAPQGVVRSLALLVLLMRSGMGCQVGGGAWGEGDGEREGKGKGRGRDPGCTAAGALRCVEGFTLL
jgi:hypothetical protein